MHTLTSRYSKRVFGVPRKRSGLRFVGWVLGVVVGLTAFYWPVQAADEPPIMLPAVSVTESLMKVNVSTSYQRFRIGDPYALSMTVANVKVPSFAYDSGLRKGMEIVSIDGKKITGLTPGQVDRLLAEPRKDVVVLVVRGGAIKKPKEIRISLTPPKEELAKADSDKK